MIWSSTFIFALVPLCLAKPLSKRWDNLAEKHSWVDIPRGWEYDSPAPADMTFDLRIGLKQDKLDELIANLMETSDPNHERYVQLQSAHFRDPYLDFKDMDSTYPRLRLRHSSHLTRNPWRQLNRGSSSTKSTPRPVIVLEAVIG
jgi:hypothetical protein